MISGTLEHGLGCIAADVVLKDELACEGRALLGGVSTMDYYEQGMSVGWVTRDVYILWYW